MSQNIEDDNIQVIKQGMFSELKRLMFIDSEQMMQVLNDKKYKQSSCQNPILDKSLLLISFEYDGKSRILIGKLEKIEMLYKRMKGELKDEEFLNWIKSSSYTKDVTSGAINQFLSDKKIKSPSLTKESDKKENENETIYQTDDEMESEINDIENDEKENFKDSDDKFIHENHLKKNELINFQVIQMKNLIKEKRSLIEELRDEINSQIITYNNENDIKLGDQTIFGKKEEMNDKFFIRFLKARDFDIMRAKEVIINYLIHRAKTIPPEQSIEWCERVIRPVLRTGEIILDKTDNLNNMIIEVTPKYHQRKNYNLEVLRIFVYQMLDLGWYLSNDNVEFTYTILVNCDGVGQSNLNKEQLQFYFSTASGLQVERNFKLIFLEPGFIIRGIMKLFEQFLNEAVRKKQMWIDMKAIKELDEQIDTSMLEDKYETGKAKSIYPDIYVEKWGQKDVPHNNKILIRGRYHMNLLKHLNIDIEKIDKMEDINL